MHGTTKMCPARPPYFSGPIDLAGKSFLIFSDRVFGHSKWPN